jgi:hypothetical protein
VKKCEKELMWAFRKKKCPAPKMESASSQQKEILRFITCPPQYTGKFQPGFLCIRNEYSVKKKRSWT